MEKNPGRTFIYFIIIHYLFSSGNLQIMQTGEVFFRVFSISLRSPILPCYFSTHPFQSPSYFELCLISMMILLAVTSALLIAGIHRHDTNLMYPTLVARVLFIIFVQVFGVSTVVAPHHVHSKWDTNKKEQDDHEPNVALRLVMLMFAMLFITILVFYCIYLVVRCLQYQRSYCRMKERRASLIQAGMIDPDAGSRRASSLPGLP
ncbi:hypothetical protein ANCCAN_08359 [Ancylostoma caninum]|uniref:DUF7027 domain-containing protein n=1 Tax=Ancylostoma caninum TaxID=29170 RepID=A0A368GMM1_ANCCA|nr:hypothetical protein ANCCAN_08359 [Ancylostoma caninum]